MEDYLFTERTYQYKVPQTPKYIKKYDLKNSVIRYTNIKNDVYNLGSATTNIANEESKEEKRKENPPLERNRYKINLLLEEEDEASISEKATKSKTDLSEFFVKKIITPKTTRQNMHRTQGLFKSPRAPQRKFYDINLNIVRKKSRNCLIMPETKKKALTTVNSKKTINKKGKENKPIKEWIHDEIEAQKKKRKVECGASVQIKRQKTKTAIAKQIQKMEEQMKNIEFQERAYRTSDKNLQNRYHLNREKDGWRRTQPLSREQVRNLTVSIMKKYNVDSALYQDSVHKLI